jgi:hypothetical protein
MGEDFSFGNIPCFDLNRNFPTILDPYNSSGIGACVDLSAETAHKLSFDLVQFRSSKFDFLNDEDLSKLTSILKVEMMDKDKTTTHYIYDSPKGKRVSHEFNIPANFKGEVRLSIFNYEGVGKFDELSLENSDAILLDDFKISKISKTVDLFDDNRFSVFPNPATNTLTVRNFESNKETNVNIFSSDGCHRYSNLLNNEKIDISFLNPGFYLISLTTESQTYTTSFTKM